MPKQEEQWQGKRDRDRDPLSRADIVEIVMVLVMLAMVGITAYSTGYVRGMGTCIDRMEHSTMGR